MKKILNKPRIKCFITAKTNLKAQNSCHQDKYLRQNGLASFAIPDLGILFRSSYLGSHYELEYMSLLSLLRFIELNRAAFQNHKIDIYSTSSLLVYQVNQNAFCEKELEKHKNLAIAYKNTLNFSLSWIPQSENRAETGMLDLPPLKTSFKMNPQDKSFNFNLDDFHTKFK
ncbi:MAG: hypothetical protein ACE5KJ_01590 [Candidatus Zixiibacteriota bacterium]